MASRRAILQFFALLFVAAAISSFTFVSADESSKSEEHAEKDTSATDDSSQEDSKEKRSQEEIMFGNQQNKPSGLVDDLMGMANTMGDDENSSSNVSEKKSSESLTTEVENSDDSSADDGQVVDKSDLMMGPGGENWYSPLPPAANPMQYLANGPILKQNLPSEDFPNALYDQEDLYRRKRQLFSHPLPLRKRSLRSSLGGMIQKRGIRLPRRSMRLKRQVDDLVGLFGNERYFDEDAQMTPHSFGGRARTVAKRHVPGRFSNYPETPEYRYPYVFQHRDDGVLSEGDLEEAGDPLEATDDIDNLMLFPPHSRYVEGDIGLMPFRSREEENEAIQKWLSRHTTPSVFRVSRRSAPFFYPIDYRYMPAPGFKKRSRFNNGGHSSGHFSGAEEEGGEFGKWGHVVQVPEAYASPEDVARLYGLASLMADEGDGSKRRRSA